MCSDFYNQEYDKCVSTGQYSSDDCSRFARCVSDEDYNGHYVNVLCSTDQYGEVTCNSTSPMQLAITEGYCYSQITPLPPPPIEDPPQVPPRDIYRDCKLSSESK